MSIRESEMNSAGGAVMLCRRYWFGGGVQGLVTGAASILSVVWNRLGRRLTDKNGACVNLIGRVE